MNNRRKLNYDVFIILRRDRTEESSDKMDVIGNNIANVNTAGYKASRVIFQDIYSQTVAPASAGNGTTGGTNPMQVGLGVQLATIGVLNTPASSQYTGNPLDLAIDGDGYFIIRNGSVYTYTRAGNFYTDSSHYLVTPTATM